MYRRIKYIKNYTFFIAIFMMLSFITQSAEAQLFDPSNTLILNTLREIAVRHNLALQEQRMQTAKMVQQVKQFYDTYTLLRNDIEFSQSLYRDFKAVDNLDLTRSYAMSNFIINADRFDYWLPGFTGEMSRATMDAEALLHNSAELQRTFESFSLLTNDEIGPDDVELRHNNAMIGQQAFSQALFEHAIKCQILAKTYDSLAVELHKQIMDQNNKFTTAERTNLLVETVKLRDLSNNYYEKYLDISQRLHMNELDMYDEKLNALRSKSNLKTLQAQINKTSKIRYGFFDIIAAPFE